MFYPSVHSAYYMTIQAFLPAFPPVWQVLESKAFDQNHHAD